MTCQYTNFQIIDKYICWGVAHPYISMIILGFIGLTWGVIWFANTHMPQETVESKPSMTKDFFDALRGMGK